VLARRLRRGRLAGPALSLASLALATLAFGAFLLHASAGAATGIPPAVAAGVADASAAPTAARDSRAGVARSAVPTPAADRNAAIPRTYTVYLTSSGGVAAVIAEALRAADQDRIRGGETPLSAGVLVVDPAEDVDAVATAVAVEAAVARVAVIDVRAAIAPR